MTTRKTKHYPTPENCQHTAGDISLDMAIGYLQQLRDKLPMVDRSTATVTGFGSMSIYFDRTLTTEDVLRDRIAELEAQVAAMKAETKRAMDSGGGGGPIEPSTK